MRFVGWFRKEIWPWEPVPEVYYDPRSLLAMGEDSACLHAKCVVVDDARAFVDLGQPDRGCAGAKTLRPVFCSMIRSSPAH